MNATNAGLVPFAPSSGYDVVDLKDAQLCEDCNVICAAPDGYCVRCGSKALLGLARVLNRDE